MKVSLVLCLVFAVVGLEAAVVYLKGAQRQKALNNALKCVKETGVKHNLVAELNKGHTTDDPKLKKFIFCFHEKYGIVGKDGKLNIDVALAELPPGVDKTDTAQVLESCKDKKGKDATETVFEIFKCFIAGSKTRIEV